MNGGFGGGRHGGRGYVRSSAAAVTAGAAPNWATLNLPLWTAAANAPWSAQAWGLVDFLSAFRDWSLQLDNWRALSRELRLYVVVHRPFVVLVYMTAYITYGRGRRCVRAHDHGR